MLGTWLILGRKPWVKLGAQPEISFGMTTRRRKPWSRKPSTYCSQPLKISVLHSKQTWRRNTRTRRSSRSVRSSEATIAAEATFIGVETADQIDKKDGLKAGVKSLLEQLFGSGSGDETCRLHKVCSVFADGVLDAFLGNTIAGKMEKKIYTIVCHDHSLFRLDVCVYKYNLAAKGFTSHYESQTVVFAAKGILDMKTVKPEVLTAYEAWLGGHLLICLRVCFVAVFVFLRLSVLRRWKALTLGPSQSPRPPQPSATMRKRRRIG